MEFLKANLLIINSFSLFILFLLLIIFKNSIKFSLLLDTLRRMLFLVILLLFYDRSRRGWQFNINFTCNLPFLPFSNLDFGINYWGFWLLIILTLLNFINILSADFKKIEKTNTYLAILLLVELGCFGVLISKEPLWFFIFFEFSILPLYLLINYYGYENRKIAANRYLIYTAISGAIILLLVVFGAIHLANQKVVSGKVLSGIEYFVKYIKELDDRYVKTLYYLLVFLAFAIKIPLIGFHFWLPYAHTEAPTAGSVLLAGIVLKLGLYGYYIFGGLEFSNLLPFLPVIFSVLNLVYGVWIVFYEKELKKFIAYSSISHMGVAWTAINIPGSENVALFYAVSHAIGTGGLFVLAGFLLENNHRREIKFYQGLIKHSPVFSLLFFLFCLINMGFPGFSGFIGEFYTIVRTFHSNHTIYIFSMAIFIFFNTWLTINLIAKIVFTSAGETEIKIHNIPRLYYLIPVLVLSILLGLKPSLLL